jgi:hypothetical protein
MIKIYYDIFTDTMRIINTKKPNAGQEVYVGICGCWQISDFKNEEMKRILKFCNYELIGQFRG